MRAAQGAPRRILIVDGYNVINVRKPVRESLHLEEARRKLTDRLHDYAGFSGQQVVLVYDAWQSGRMRRSVEEWGPLTVVFTQKGETADCYIERLCDEFQQDMAQRRVEVRVATSDRVEQTIAFGRGAVRMSSRELLMEMESIRQGQEKCTASPGRRSATVMERLPESVRARLEQLRRGEQ